MSNGLKDARRAGRFERSFAIAPHPLMRATGQTCAIELLDNVLELVGDGRNELAVNELAAEDDLRTGPTVQRHDLRAGATAPELCGLAPPQDQLRSRVLDPSALRPEGARSLPHRSKHREERLVNIQILR
jgi:hypothetical protein